MLLATHEHMLYLDHKAAINLKMRFTLVGAGSLSHPYERDLIVVATFEGYLVALRANSCEEENIHETISALRTNGLKLHSEEMYQF